MKIKLFYFLILFASNVLAESHLLYFKGNKHFNDRELYEALNINDPYPFEFYKSAPSINPKLIPITIDTLKNYYKTHGFYHTQINSTEHNKSITLDIHENQPVKISEIQIDSPLNIKDTIAFKVGDIFDADKFIQTKKAIKSDYKNKGYCNAKYDTKAYINIVTNSASLLFKIKPGKICFFTNIEIFNPSNIKKDIIASLLYFKKDTQYSQTIIDKSYRNLYSHGGISQAIINTSIYKKNDVNATVKVRASQKPIRFEVGVGISSDQGPSFTMGIKHRNFFGNLKTLGISTSVTKILQSVKLDFTMPLIHANTFGAEIGTTNENFLGFKELSVLAKTYLLQRYLVNNFQETLLIDKSKSYHSSDLAIFPESTLLVISPQVKWHYNTIQKPLNPEQGHFLTTTLQGSLLSQISDATYYKYDLVGGYIIPLHPSIIALKAEIGSLNTLAGSVPPSYRFFAGGLYSNRAYGYRELGPKDSNNHPTGFNALMDTTAEYRFHIHGKFNGVIFNDNTFISQNSFFTPLSGYYSAGFGLQYDTPIGPLAIDFGFDIFKPLKQHAINFHVGETF